MPDEQNVLLLEEHQEYNCWRRPSMPCLLLWLLVIIIVICFVVGIIILIIQSTLKPPHAQTVCGVVEGYYQVEADVHVFKGIPYAVAPSGDRRWRRPVPLTVGKGGEFGTCWQGVYKAVEFGDRCPEIDANGKVIGSEDCLLVDVYADRVLKKGEDLLPVVVWLHGSRMDSPGTSYGPRMPALDTVYTSKLVVVSVQARLGPLGFLVAEELGKDQTGNYGLWDQIEALRWVRDNIKGFDGDPNNVTLVGHGTGATAALALTLSPHAKGLFHATWLMSPSPTVKSTLEEAKAANVKLINATKCRDEKCLRNLPLEDLLKAAADQWKAPFIAQFPKPGEIQHPMIVVDGDLLPMAPAEILKSKAGNHSDVPVLIGSTAQEVDASWVGSGLETLPAGKFVNYTRTSLAALNSSLSVEQVLSVYNFSTSAAADVEWKLTTMVSDLRLGCGLNELAAKMASAFTSPIYRYVVTFQPAEAQAGAKYAHHGLDTQAFFTPTRWTAANPHPNDLLFEEVVRKLGEGFIRLHGLQGWTVYPNSTALLNTNQTELGGSYHEKECALWKKHGLLGYAWVN